MPLPACYRQMTTPTGTTSTTSSPRRPRAPPAYSTTPMRPPPVYSPIRPPPVYTPRASARSSCRQPSAAAPTGGIHPTTTTTRARTIPVPSAARERPMSGGDMLFLIFIGGLIMVLTTAVIDLENGMLRWVMCGFLTVAVCIMGVVLGHIFVRNKYARRRRDSEAAAGRGGCAGDVDVDLEMQ